MEGKTAMTNENIEESLTTLESAPESIVEPESIVKPEPAAAASPAPGPEPIPEPIREPTPEPIPAPVREPTPEPIPKPHPEPSPEPTPKPDEDEPTESFADLLSQFEKSHSHKAAPGQKQLQGTVVSLSADQVFLDIGYKTEGVLPRSAFDNNADKAKA